MSDERLSDTLAADEERALAEALACAVRPGGITTERHEALLARVLLHETHAPSPDEDPFRPITPEEQREAERLARALDEGSSHPDLVLARALGNALGRDPESSGVVEGALDRAFAQAAPRRARPNVVFVAFGGVAAAIAAAACVVFFLRTPAREANEPLEFARSRSLAPLFGPDDTALGASARLDRITEARGRDFRENRYLAWGVR